MTLAVEFYWNVILRHRGKLAILGWIWFIYTLVVTLDFLRQMDATVTPDDRTAITEAGVLAALIGGDLIVFFLACQFTASHFYVMQMSVTPKGLAGHHAMHEASRATVQLNDPPASDSTVV